MFNLFVNLFNAFKPLRMPQTESHISQSDDFVALLDQLFFLLLL